MDAAGLGGTLMARRLTLVAVTLAAVVIAALPLVLALSLGWYHTRFMADVLGKGAGIYVLLVLIYLFWLPATVFGLVFVYDRLGLHYHPMDVSPRKAGRRERLRRRATARSIAAEEAAQVAAQRARRRRTQAAGTPKAAGQSAATGAPKAVGEPKAADRPKAAGGAGPGSGSNGVGGSTGAPGSEGTSGRRRPKAG